MLDFSSCKNLTITLFTLQIYVPSKLYWLLGVVPLIDNDADFALEDDSRAEITQRYH